MKAKTILMYAAVFFIAASCDSGEKSNSETITVSDEKITLSTVLEDEACFDEKMDRWFMKFNQLQEEGYTMDDANKEAVTTVASEFKTCSTKPA